MKSSGIGGQAVLEGVMMKNKSKYAIAVRKPDGEIGITRGTCKSIGSKAVFFRLPIIRGVVVFVESLILGMRSLTYSASFYEEEEEKVVTEKEEIDKARKEKIENGLVVALSVVLAVAFFMILPFFLAELLSAKIQSQSILTIVEGALRIVLFVGYVIAISYMKEIQRVFMYHGAEHKSINCIENGLELTVGNVRRQSKHHRRCGTSFVLIVMFVSIIFFVFIPPANIWLRMILRVLLIPVIAGVAYEFIRLAGNTDNKVVSILSKPGMFLQRLTTREPDDKMIEVAIASVEEIFDWKEYQRRCMAVKNRKSKKEENTPQEISEKEKKSKKSRAQLAKEIAEREKEYKTLAKERARQIKEQEEKEAALEKRVRDLEKKKAQLYATPSEDIDKEEDDGLSNLDHFFDKEEDSKDSTEKEA